MHGVSGARAHGVSRDLTQGPVRTGSIEARGHGGPVGTVHARAHGVTWELLPSSWRFLLRFQASLLDGVDVLFSSDSLSMNV